MARPITNADEHLRGMWFCEQCGTSHEGGSAPGYCARCGHHLFENGLDIVGEGRPLPAPRAPLPKPKARGGQKHLGVPPSATPARRSRSLSRAGLGAMLAISMLAASADLDAGL